MENIRRTKAILKNLFSKQGDSKSFHLACL